MEKQTRVNKYKNLRDEMKEEVTIDRQAVKATEEINDDFLAFLPKEEKPDVEDTLIEPLSYETLQKNDDEVKQALNEAKLNVGKDQYNTRLDILNKIKQDESDDVPAHEYQAKDFSKGHAVKKEPQAKMSLLEKLAAMSPEEDAQELKKFEEDMTVAELMKSKKKTRVKQVQSVNEKNSVEEDIRPKKKKENVYNEDEEENNKVVTILNYVVLGFIVILIILVFFVVKQLLF